MAMEGTVKTPFGPMQKKTAVIAGGGAVILIGVVYYRSKKAAAANAAATTAAATTDANTGQSGIDPATGFPYGSAEDAAAIAGQQGISYNPYSPLGGGGPTGQYPQTGPPFTSNSAWAMFCEQTMGSTGSDAIAAALGHYLTGSPLQSGEPTMVDQAIAIGGYPPVAGPNGMPPALNTNNPNPNPSGATNPVTGLRQTAGGLGPRDATAQIAWDASNGATSYKVTSVKGTVQMMGATSAQIHSIPNNAGDFGKGASTTVTVLAEPAASGATPATLIVKV